MRMRLFLSLVCLVGYGVAEPPAPSAPARTSKDEATSTADAPASENSGGRADEETGADLDLADAIDAADVAALREKWGVEIASLRTTANGYLLDFRFKVVDPEKTGCIFDVRKKPCLIDQETGAKFAVPAPPKVGALRTSRKPKAGAISFLLFANPGCYVAPGKKVAIAIGDFAVKNLVVDDGANSTPRATDTPQE